MKTFINLLTGFFLILNTSITELEGFEVVSQDKKENITLYSKIVDGLYRGFKIDFKGGIYTRPFWNSEKSPTYGPQIFYNDINNDLKEELIITLNIGYGTGVLLEEVHVFHTKDSHLSEVLIDHPLAIIYKNVKTELSSEEAKIRVGEKEYRVDVTPYEIKPENLFDDIAFGSIMDYEVIDKQLLVRVSGQITPAMFVGDIIITYEYRNKMYQAKKIDFITDINKNPFYGPVES